MRQSDFNLLPGLASICPAEVSLEMFSHMCRVQAFEQGVMAAINAREIRIAIYLSSGQEAVAAALAVTEARKFLTFTQHRAHDIYLAFGGPPQRLRDELLGRPTGTSGGRAGSNCIQLHEGGVSMFGHHGLIGENVPLGVGAALGSGLPALCILGDGALEEDYVLAAMGFAATHALPVLFVCVDNDLSILTSTAARRSWDATRVAEAFGLAVADIADDPWTVRHHVMAFATSLPAFLNIRVCRKYWHVGAGIDGPPEWDRIALVRAELERLGLAPEVLRIEAETRREMELVWAKEPLPKPSGN